MGTSVVLAMNQLTNREYTTRLAWIKLQWNQPTLTDHYLMRVAQRIIQYAGMSRRNPNKIKIEDQRIDFVEAKTELVARTREEATRAAKQRWLGRLPVVGRLLNSDGDSS